MKNIELATLSMESGFIRRMKTEGEPYINARCEEGYIRGYHNARLYYRSYQADDAIATITIVHGFSEFSDKYSEMIYVFLKNHYSVFIMDQRGHGNSERETDNLQKVYVNNFNEYVCDQHRFFRKVVSKTPLPHYIFGHSMGGCITTLYLEKYPYDYKKAVLSSPMVRLKAKRIPFFVLRIASAFEVRLGNGEDYTPGQGGFDASYQLDTSSCMSRERYLYTMNKRRENPNYQTWGGSYAWLYAACRADHFLERDIRKISVPVLMFVAGQDRLVNVARACIISRRIPECELVRVPNSRHEIFHAGARERKNYYRKLLRFFN